jgi:ADP-heptose:LPS heptosyltransferase
LVLRPGALGDAVLTLPLLRSLRAAGAKQITVLGSRSSWAFLPESPELKILDLNSPAWLGLFALGLEFPIEVQTFLEQTELAIVYLKAPRDGVEAALCNAGVKQVLGATPPLQDETGPVHAAERLLEVLGEQVAHDTRWPVLTPDAAAIRSARAKLNLKENARLFVFHPGSGGRKKCWPAERYARAAHFAQEKLGLTPVMLGGEADTEVLQRVEGEWAPTYRVWNWPLREVAALLAGAELYLGNDSGVTHLAGQLAPKTIALFGPTDPNVWRPLGPNVTVLRANEHALAPMEELLEERVLTEIRNACLQEGGHSCPP